MNIKWKEDKKSEFGKEFSDDVIVRSFIATFTSLLNIIPFFESFLSCHQMYQWITWVQHSMKNDERVKENRESIKDGNDKK